MWRISYKLTFTILLFCSTAFAQEKFLLLIPGFFNIPGQNVSGGFEYFSKTIQTAVRDSGYTPIVIRNLNPVGSIGENGERLLADLNALVNEHPQARFTVIAHSAGGLYLGRALTVRADLPIDNVVTISTPYSGAALIEVLKSVPGIKVVAEALNLKNLEEFELKNMQSEVAALKIPQHVRWIALGAQQPACSLFSCARPDYQTWLLSLTWRFTKKAGDGVVAIDSATAEGVFMPSQEGGLKNIETWPQFVIPLEHWKVVLDSGFFSLLGETNTGWIATAQRQMILHILANLH